MPLVPLHDENPRRYITAHFVTIGLIAANIVLWLLGEASGTALSAAYGFGVVPARLFEDAELPDDLAQVAPVLTLVTYQFLHGGVLHLAFNMLFAWVFADNVEDALGHGRFLLFWLVCGAVAGIVHAIAEPGSIVPMIGASGAISGILGAYAVLYPRARILVLAFGVVPIRLPALVTIAAWFLQDLIWATAGTSGREDVALWAHIGGFVAGAALILPFRWRLVPAGPWR